MQSPMLERASANDMASCAFNTTADASAATATTNFLTVIFYLLDLSQ